MESSADCIHYSHASSVLLYCWHSYVTKSPSGLFFCAMNYGVHSIMYGYYFLMAIKCKPKASNRYCMDAMKFEMALKVYRILTYTHAQLLGSMYVVDECQNHHDCSDISGTCMRPGNVRRSRSLFLLLVSFSHES